MTTNRPRLGTPEYDAINREHLERPREGDYWHDMFCGILVVLRVRGDELTICQHKKDVDRNHWTWDLSKLEIISKKDFRKKLLYGEGNVAEKCWADVAPCAQIWAVEAIGARRGKKNKKPSYLGRVYNFVMDVNS